MLDIFLHFSNLKVGNQTERRNGRRSRQDTDRDYIRSTTVTVVWHGTCVPEQVGVPIGAAVLFDVASMVWKRESFCKI